MKPFITSSLSLLLYGLVGLIAPLHGQSASLLAKLPYSNGQSFVVSQGFHSPPTHIKKDDFAIDFTQDGCDAYAKQAVAAVPGTAWIVQQSGYNGGYGTQLLVLGNGNVVTRYAHLIPSSVSVKAGDTVAQGTPIGLIGNTGLVAGTACGIHPGTHLHFAMYQKNTDGTFTAEDPEPISGYANITEGHWYRSDNVSPSDAMRNADQSAIALQTIGGLASTIGEASPPASSSGKIFSATSSTQNDSFANSETLPASSSNSLAAISGPNYFSQINAASFPSSAVMTTNVSSSASILPSGMVIAASAPTVFASSSGNYDAVVQPSVLAPTGGVVVISTPSTPNSMISLLTSVPPGGSSTLDTASTSSSDAGALASSTSGSEINTASSSLSQSSSSLVTLSAPIPLNGAESVASFDSSALVINLAWQPSKTASGSSATVYNVFLENGSSASSIFLASTTRTSFAYNVPESDFSGTPDIFAIQATDDAGDQSAIVTSSVRLPNWSSVIQATDDDGSRPSWYSDNWYDLGTGFHGTIRSLTLEGYINSDIYGGSSVAIQEFPDVTYATPDHVFPLSNLPFAQATAKLTANNLKIPLSSEKYYRLTTLQAYQNRSVVLKGTDATGTAMFDEFAPGIGGIQNTYPFYPYLAALIDPEKEVIMPPTLSGNLTTNFNAVNSTITVSWSEATDADEPLIAPTYQVNLSTSTTLDPAQWQSAGNNLSFIFNVTLPHAYMIGVRALDDFGNPSVPIVAQWNFPTSYAPLAQFDHSAVLSSNGGAQKITFAATTTATAIDFWTAHNRTGAIRDNAQTQLFIYKDIGLPYSASDPSSVGDEILSGNPVVADLSYGDAEEAYQFAGPITFSPGSYWFSLIMGPSHVTDETSIYGSSGDAYPGGYWSTSPGQDAYFRIVVNE